MSFMYICLEGIDGAGKSTQVKLITQWLDDMGYDVELLVEPTSSPVGILIRKMLQNPKATDSDFQKTLGLLFAADRMILKDKIEKTDEKRILISDRCFYSSMAYQNHLEWIKEINRFAKKPDMVILLDIDEKTAVSRCQGTDKFENETFLKKVRHNYLKMAKKEGFIIIDATNGVKLIHHNLKKALASNLGICDGGIID